MKTTSFIRIPIALLFFSVVASPATSQDIQLNVSKPDNYALRKMVVVKKSGDKVTSFLKIDSFDPETGVFIMEGATGEATEILASDINTIEFQQTVRKQSMGAQQAHWEINVTPGPEVKYKVGQNALRIESGELVFPANSPSADTSGAEFPASDPAPRRGGSVSSVKKLEANRLTVDGPNKSFLVEVKNVMYTTETLGSSGLSGIRK
jgi:hypothetical protein